MIREATFFRDDSCSARFIFVPRAVFSIYGLARGALLKNQSSELRNKVATLSKKLMATSACFI